MEAAHFGSLGIEEGSTWALELLAGAEETEVELVEAKTGRTCSWQPLPRLTETEADLVALEPVRRCARTDPSFELEAGKLQPNRVLTPGLKEMA